MGYADEGVRNIVKHCQVEKISDIAQSIKQRFANPLFFSFICSWLVVNWPITVGLFWFDSKQIEKAGYNSIFDFIAAKINLQDSLVHPLCFAFGYTFLMPTLHNIIRAFYSWTAKWGDNWNLSITRGVKIPFEKYLKFREEYDKRSKILEEVINKESISQAQVNSIQTELLLVQSNVTELKNRITESDTFIQQLFDVKLLDGYWTNRYNDRISKGLTGIEDVYIADGKYYIVGRFGEMKHVFNIVNFYFDSRVRRIFFIKDRVNQEQVVLVDSGVAQPRFNPNFLHVERSDLLVGVENGTTQIEYVKKPIAPVVTPEDNTR